MRLALVQQRAKEIAAPVAYVNMTGGQDDLVFDGDTIVVATDGSVLARTPQFDDQLIVVDIECATGSSRPDVVISEEPTSFTCSVAPAVATRLSNEAEMWQALVMGLRLCW